MPHRPEPIRLLPLALAALLASCGGGEAPTATAEGRASPLAATPGAADAGAAKATAASSAVTAAADTVTPDSPVASRVTVTTVATGLNRPWSVAFLPDGRMLVTEKGGQLRVVQANGTLSAPVTGLPAVDTGGQGGLFDVAVAPDFATSRRIYLSFAERGTGADAGRNGLAVGWGTLDATETSLQDWRVIHRQVPKVASGNHFGGRLVLAPGNLIFITHGDRFSASERGKAQDLRYGHGKVMRLSTDGTVPRTNPYAQWRAAQQGIWSHGHRNVQGAALHPVTGELWTSEHGPQGGDEVNRTLPGLNFGWPLVSYGCEYGSPVGNCTPVGGASSGAGFTQPLTYWVPISIAPSGLAIHSGNVFPEWRGDFFIGALAGQALWRLRMNGNVIVSREAVQTGLNERIRDVREGPDGALYIATDSAAGRVLRVVPQP